jgi:hypothetical protein
MNTTTTITVSSGGPTAERKLHEKIEDYLRRIDIVDDSKTLTLLRQAASVIRDASKTSKAVNKNLELYIILHDMQTIIEQLQKKESTSKIKSYTNAVRSALDSSMSKMTVEKTVNSKAIKAIREFTIVIVNEAEREKLKEMITKNIMKKMQAKKVRNIIRLDNESLRIQAKSEAARNVLQKKSKVLRRVVESITI